MLWKMFAGSKLVYVVDAPDSDAAFREARKYDPDINGTQPMTKVEEDIWRKEVGRPVL